MRRIARTVVLSITLASLGVVAPVASANARPMTDTTSRGPKKYTLIGELAIPRLNLTSPIYSGVTMDVFARGMGYWPGSALPGEVGNIVLAGHRTSRPRPLFDIQKIQVGDPITVKHEGHTYTYIVTNRKVVTPASIWITRPTKDATLTIFACHPRGSIKYRYVVFAKLSQ